MESRKIEPNETKFNKNSIQSNRILWEKMSMKNCNRVAATEIGMARFVSSN